MKKNYLILLTVFVSSYCLSQQKYHPLLKNTTWYQAVAYMTGPGYYWYHIEKDTIVNAKTYKKYKYISSGIIVSGACLLREDTIQRKVWKIDKGQSTEHLMYDFTLNVAGTLPVYYNGNMAYTLTVNKVDSVLTKLILVDSLCSLLVCLKNIDSEGRESIN